MRPVTVIARRQLHSTAFTCEPMTGLFHRIARHAAEQPHRVALGDPTSSIRYGALLPSLQLRADALRTGGIRRLALSGDNGVDWVLMDLAARMAGITVVPIPPFFTAQQIKHSLDRARVDGVWSRSSAAWPGFEPTPLPGGWLHRRDTATLALPDGVAKITFTSGTTGEPKGVLLRQAAMEAVVQSLAEVIALRPGHVHLSVLPLAVLLENLAGVDLSLWIGGEVRLPDSRSLGLLGSSRVEVARFADSVRRFSAQSLILTPQLLQTLVEHCERTTTASPELRFVAVGGATVPPALLERAWRAGIPAYQGYGLSELGSVVALNVPHHNRTGSVGRLLPHARLRVGADGELRLRGSALFSGYLEDAGRIDAPPSEFATGDLGRCDADGYLWLSGRIKNQIVTSFGRNVAPEWVESELTLEPEILQAAVFGEARPFNTAVLVPAGQCSHAQLQTAVQRCNRRLPDYARVGPWIRAAEPFSVDNGQWTGTGRPRRDRIVSAYGEQIEAVYQHPRVSQDL